MLLNLCHVRLIHETLQSIILPHSNKVKHENVTQSIFIFIKLLYSEMHTTEIGNLTLK